jgi:hypothetical protein
MMIDLTSVYKLHCVFRSLLIFGKGCINAFGCRIEDRLALTRHLFCALAISKGVPCERCSILFWRETPEKARHRYFPLRCNSDCPFILILRSLEKSSFYHILGQTSECAILRLDGAFVLSIQPGIPTRPTRSRHAVTSQTDFQFCL